MELTSKTRETEKELADLLNRIEDLQLQNEFNKKIDGGFKRMIYKLNNFMNEYPKTIEKYSDEIKEVLKGTDEWYKNMGHEPIVNLDCCS